MVEVKTVKSTEAPNVTIPIKWIDSQNVERLWTASGWVLLENWTSEEDKTRINQLEQELSDLKSRVEALEV